MRKIFKVAGLGLFALLAGCSTVASLNPFAAKVEPKNVPAALVEFKPSLDVKNVWSASVGRAGNYVFSPAQSRDSIVAAAADGSISRVSLADGSSQSRIKADTSLTSGAGADANTVAVAGEKGMLLAYDAEGKLRWKIQASSEIISAPVVGGGLVIVRSIDNRIAAYEVDTGKRKWAVDRPAPSLTLRTSPGMLIVGPTLVVALPGGKLLSLSLANGGPRWEVSIGDPRGATELERIADVAGFPAVFGRDVCAAAYQGRIACVDVVTGAVRWAKKFTAGAGVGIDERFVYAVDDRGAVYAYTRESGQSVWRNEKLLHRGLSTPVALGRHIAVADSQGFVHFLSREDGSFVNRLATDGSPVIAPPILAGAKLIVQTRSGTLSAFAAE